MSEVMPRRDGLRRSVEAYLKGLEERGYSEKTIRGYGYALRRTHRELARNGRPRSPTRLREEDIRALQRAFAADPWLLRTVSVCLKSMGCPHPIPYRIPPRTRVRWLTPSQADEVLDTALASGPPCSTLVHLELENGFRRVSAMRATVQDFRTSPILVRGKGRDYTMWPHPRLPQILRSTYEWRERMGFAASRYLIPARSRRLGNSVGPYSERGIDGVLQRVATKSGISLSHHTLRRTFGRTLWEALGRRDIETVSEVMGHKSIDQTRLYLGINLDDMASAMERLAAYRKTPRAYLQPETQG